MKKLLILIIFLFLLSLAPGLVLAAPEDEANEVLIRLFYGEEDCPYCREEIKYLNILKNNYPTLTVEKYEIWDDLDNYSGIQILSEIYGGKQTAVPIAFIGEEMIVGYLGDDVTGKKLEEEIQKCLINTCIDPFSKFDEETKNLLLKIGGGEEDLETSKITKESKIEIWYIILGFVLISSLGSLIYIWKILKKSNK